MLNDSVLILNRDIVQSEIQDINDFLERYHWKMEATQTGLRYWIYKKGNGNSVVKGAKVGIYYTIKLLNGDMIFKSDPVRPVNFILGKREVTSGLEEGILLMKEGDQARFIVPSHLAFGLLGDLDKIPNRAILLYDVTLDEVINPK